MAGAAHLLCHLFQEHCVLSSLVFPLLLCSPKPPPSTDPCSPPRSPLSWDCAPVVSPPTTSLQPSSSLEVLPALLPTSLEQASPPLQAAVPALLPELELAFQQPQVCGVPQGLSQARLPPAELPLPPGQLQQVTLLQVGTSLCRGCLCARAWKGRQDLTTGQAGEGEKEDDEPWGSCPRRAQKLAIPQGWKMAVFIFAPLAGRPVPRGLCPPSYRVEDQGTYVARNGVLHSSSPDSAPPFLSTLLLQLAQLEKSS